MNNPGLLKGCKACENTLCEHCAIKTERARIDHVDALTDAYREGYNCGSFVGEQDVLKRIGTYLACNGVEERIIATERLYSIPGSFSTHDFINYIQSLRKIEP
ncbi:MAG: hypothetical protein PHC39_04815 [Proteiniphilum sp.]|nr:hypothetical protein [Proteiniphilum sp.]